MKRQQGFSLIEISVSLLLASLGVLGFMSLQLNMQSSEMESMQYEEAVRSVNFIAGQIKANRYAAACYGLEQQGVSYVGTGWDPSLDYNCTVAGNIETQTQVSDDIMAWDSLLDGELVSLTGQDVGSMEGARGCIGYNDANRSFTITVAWQGLQPTVAPTSSCGENLYGDETTRRAYTMIVEIPKLN
ncbi:MAG: prepilin-type N-terminal cleavage/methylation domain-containing protein [Reinekea sp.]